MKSSMLVPLFAIGGILVSSAVAQTPAPSDQTQTQTQRARSHLRANGGMMVNRLAKRLNLTPDQQSQARTIFQNARQQAQALRPQLQTARQSMSAAIKSDNEAQIDQLSQQNAQLNSSMRAIHAKAMAKFYATLTPDQKAKFDAMKANRRINAMGRLRANKTKNG